MKLEAIVKRTVQPEDDFVIVRFKKDPQKQNFKVFLNEKPFRKIYMYDALVMNIKYRSVELDAEEGIYLTELFCEAWKVVDK